MLQLLRPTFWLKLSYEVSVIVSLTLLLVALWWKRDRVMLALTGDTVIHYTFLDGVWFVFFKCCGICSGEWTRLLTSCPCCPRRWKHTNLVKALGRFVGVYSRAVEIRNIVVGDLPMSQRGDFYVTVRCKHNPRLVTSVREDEEPKVVHFPEVLTLKMRDNWLEEHVIVQVMELEVVGAKELCSVHIGAMRIMEWAKSEDDKRKRFEMKPQNVVVETVTQPWILMEFDTAADIRSSDFLHGNTDLVVLTTTTFDYATGDRRTQLADGDEHDMNMITMKETYPLLDNAGSVVQEPFETDLQFIAGWRRTVVRCVNVCNFVVGATWLIYAVFRYYISSCYRRFRWLEIADQKNATFPIPTHQLMEIIQACKDEVRGTGIDEGVSPCRPTDPQVEELCENLHDRQPRPTAFSTWFMWYLGVELPEVLTPPCFDGLCKFRNHLTEWDTEIILIGLALLALAALIRQCGHCLVRRKKIKLNELRAQQTNQERRTRRKYSRH